MNCDGSAGWRDLRVEGEHDQPRCRLQAGGALRPSAESDVHMAKIAILVEKIYEDLELQYPRLRLKEAGHTVEIIGPKAGETYVGKHGYPQKSEKAASAVNAS